MSEAKPAILWIGGFPQPRPQYWEAALMRAGLPVTRADNIYLALAQIGRGTLQPAAVVVCVDALPAAELEFFTLVSRLGARPAAYACASADAAEPLDAAVCAGAGVIHTPEQLEQVLRALRGAPAATDVSLPPVATPAAAPPSPVVEEVPLPPPIRLAPAVEAPAESTDFEADEPPSPERPTRTPVPWRRVSTGPARKPPRTRERPVSDAPAAQPPEAPPRSTPNADTTAPPPESQPAEPTPGLYDGPLLSPEELEMLMTDDFRTRPPRGGETEGSTP